MDESIGTPTTRSQRVSRLLCLAGVLFLWGSFYVYMPTLPTYAQSKADSLAVVGVILAQYGLWQAILRLPLGIVVDWAGRRKPFILAGLALSAVGAWLMGRAGSAQELLVGRAITGMAAASWVPLTVLFSSLFPLHEALRATALLSLTAQVARLVFTSATGSLNAAGGYGLAFWIAAAVAGLGIVAMLPLREQARPRRKPSVSGLGRLFVRRDVLVPSLLSAVSQYATWAIPLSFVPILATQLGASGVALSMVTTFYLAMVALGSFLAAMAANRFGPRRVVVACFVLLTAGCSTIALTRGMLALFVGQFLLGMGQGTLYPVLMGMSIRDVADQERTIAMGLHQAVYATGMFAGPWLSGILADAVGLQPMVGVTGFACLVLALLLMRLVPREPLPSAARG